MNIVHFPTTDESNYLYFLDFLTDFSYNELEYLLSQLHLAKNGEVIVEYSESSSKTISYGEFVTDLRYDFSHYDDVKRVLLDINLFNKFIQELPIIPF